MDSKDYNHVLYHSTFSTCSLMVRLSFACRGEAEDPQNTVVLKEEHVDVAKKEQLSEYFLCDVNAYGEVPVIVPVDGKSIRDSLDVTLYLAKFYPALIPGEHATEIEHLLRELHGINFFSVSFPGKPDSPLGTLKTLDQRLGEDISERYRAAIQIKIERVKKEKLEAVMSKEEVEDNERRTHAIMSALETVLKGSSTGWCFNVDRPSALDAHLMIFIARMQDVAQDRLIPEFLLQWAEKFMERDEWKELMQGRRTLPPPLLVSKRS